jgi:cyclopropane fatty-acyl-phospholipid synthase-like methyltransferase
MDIATVKQRQQAAWAAGDYAAVGARLLLTAELLCEAVDLRAGERVLDVACGNGNAALKTDMVEVARRFDVSDDDTLVMRQDYLEAVIHKPAP